MSDAARSTRHRLTPFLSVMVVLVGWVAVGAVWTHGFAAFTSFSAARVAAGPLPRPAPSFAVIDHEGRNLDLGSAATAFRMVQPMYLSCTTACPIAMSRLHHLAHLLSDIPPERLQAVSVSVDNDPTDAMRSAWEAHGSPANWSFVTPVDGAGDRELRDLGVWLYRRADGLVDHSVDIFVIDPAGQVVRILSVDDDVEQLAATMREVVR